MTFEGSEKLNTKRWLEAHVDLVVHGLIKTSDDSIPGHGSNNLND